MGVNLKFLQKKVKGSDRNVSTVVLRAFLSQTFPFIILTGNSRFLVQFEIICTREFFKDAKLQSPCALVQFWRR